MMRQLLTVGLVLLLCHVRVATAAEGKLNVLLIISDDLRAELGCYGGRAVTPNLDALAGRGVRFDRAYCQYPLCNPSRTSMLTGRDPSTTRIFGNRENFRDAHPDWVSLPQLFKDHGYVTARAGKIFHGAGIDDPLAWSKPNERAAADTGDDEAPSTNPSSRPSMTRAQYSDRIVVLDGDGESHGDFRTADRVIDMLRQNQANEKPFFIACGFVKPHSPPTAPKRFFELFPVEKIVLPVDFQPRPTVPSGFPRGSIRPRNADLFIGREATEQAAREMIRAYLASASWMDFNCGRVLAELERLGLRERTVVVFWGDHGYQLGEKGKWSKAGSLWEQGTRTPFVIAAPHAVGNGKPCPRVVQNLDLYRTLAELCGLQVQGGVEGRSLVPLLNDPNHEWNHPAFTIWSEDGRGPTGIAIRTERWRYAEFGPGGVGEPMLIDEEHDPHELKNLADDPQHGAVRAELARQLKAYAARYAPGR